MNQLLGPDGLTPLREYAGYQGGGSGFGGQLRDWNPSLESADEALLPTLERGNARAEDLVRNNGYAANAIQLHQDHVVGAFFRLSYRPNWRYLGLTQEDARAFARDVEDAWWEFAEDDHCYIDVERKRTFTMMIREGVATHAFNGELFTQPCWNKQNSNRIFKTQFKMVSPKRISNPFGKTDSKNLRAGIQINNAGAAMGYHVSSDAYPSWTANEWKFIPRELSSGRPAMIHIFEPLEDGQSRGANQFYSVMEQMKMLDSLQKTQLQSAIVKAMYALTIESELDSESAMEFMLGAGDGGKSKFNDMLKLLNTYYAASPVKMNGVKASHLAPGDSLNLLTAQNADNGFSTFEAALLRNVAAGLGVSYEQLSRNYSQLSYSTARASANESWAYFMGRRKFIAARMASQMFICWLEEAIVRGVIRLPSRAKFAFHEARNSWSKCEWIGSGRMAIDGLKEVQEAVMLIEAGLSTFEIECAKRGLDYEDVFAQQVLEMQARKDAGLKPPAWAAQIFSNNMQQSNQEGGDANAA